MKAFPHLVEMYNKNASKGLAVITVSVDPMDEQERIDEANKFLRKTKAPYPAFHLKEPDEVWNKKLDFNIPPCYYVFDRRGKWVRFRGVDYDEPEVMLRAMDKAILQMLDDK